MKPSVLFTSVCVLAFMAGCREQPEKLPRPVPTPPLVDVNSTREARGGCNLPGSGRTRTKVDVNATQKSQGPCNSGCPILKFFERPVVSIHLIIINSILFEIIGCCKRSGLKLLWRALWNFNQKDTPEKRHLEQVWIIVNSIATLTLITGITPILALFLQRIIPLSGVTLKGIIFVSIIGFVSSIMALEQLLVLIGISLNDQYKQRLVLCAAVAHTCALQAVVIIFLLLIYSIIWWGYLIGIGVFWFWGFNIAIRNTDSIIIREKGQNEKQ